MTLSIMGWLFVAVLVGASTGGLLLWLLGWPRLPRSSAFTTTETLDLLKIALAVVAGFGGVVILSVNHRKQRFAEKAHDLAENQDDREKTKLFNERFAAAAEQLAHERAQVRLAGVYAMAGLADDWDSGRQKCVEVLIAYLRLSQTKDRAPGAGEDEVVATIFRTFRERLAHSGTWCDVDFDFTGMTFVDADFGGLRFAGSVSFDGAVFSGAETSFADAWFQGKLSCHGTEFGADTTNLHEVWFEKGKAEFVGASFRALDLSDALVHRATVDFHRCVFDGPVNGLRLRVDPGVLRFELGVVRGSVDFRLAQIGGDDDPSVLDLLFRRSSRIDRAVLAVTGCEVTGADLTMDDIFIEHGQVIVMDLVLRDGTLRVRPNVMRHPSLVARRIDARDATVDIPVPARFWEMTQEGRATEAGDTPPPVST
jgi:uncharacterized protein YjbI with pentapeptide repeats